MAKLGFTPKQAARRSAGGIEEALGPVDVAMYVAKE